ncbi:MAG: LPXTG cell wall anchor domain-containing protein [Acidimicrobiia bacterium]|jgi:LPXTG-motif cell wall-anchored protein
MRKRLGALGALVVLALATAGVLAAPAGAQTASGFSCTYTVGPTALPPGGGPVTVSGTAPGSTTVRIFVDGALVATVPSAPVTGAFSATVVITGAVEVAVALDDYPSTPCIGVGGAEVVAGGGGANATGVNATGRLARTGSSGTKPVVLAGVAALSLGLVLVVAARRRINVHGRD